ncbi:MAG TPA: choice-of-anchor D domain-containing protein, partial [Candidatus Sulfotelmatobacter sp.]|nr:choice-of-anchor D domain-containing protein [Candidatus Sulfotelmatobacter sp.]
MGLAFLVGCQGVSAGSNQQQITGSLTLSGGSIDFGKVAVGASKTLTVTATNSETQSVTISGTAVSSKYFTLIAPSIPVTIPAGQSATVSVKFTPNAVGTFTANMSVASDATNDTASLSLLGTGTAQGQLGLSPSSEDFGSVVVGTQQTQAVVLSNEGAAPVNISQIDISGAGFQLSGIAAPLTLNTGQSASFTVAFAPVTNGSTSGTVTITSDGANPTVTMALSGTGISAGALGSRPNTLTFGNVQVGSKQTLSETLTNTGGTSVTISNIGISGTGFSMSGITAPVTLAAGQSASFSVSFTPLSAGSASGNITVTSSASNPTLTIPMSGTGVAQGALGSNPTSLSFGSVQVGAKQTLSETVTNTGGSSVTISNVGVSGSGFTLSGITAPVTLTSGQSASFSVSFNPPSAGAVAGSITITSNGSNPTLTIPLSGTGVAAGVLGSNPTSLSFGSVQVGTKQTLTETVTNTGGSSVTISNVGVAGGSGFSMSGITAPLTLTAGQSASFSVSFNPPSAGTVSGTVTVTSNASNPTLTIPLSGTGVAAGALGSNPTSLSFGSVQVGTKQTLSETVTNTGGTSVTISNVGISGTGFTFSGIATPLTLTTGQSATFSVSFTPPATGSASGNVSITSNASNPTLTIPVSGTGIAQGALGSNPTSLSFGSVQVGTKQTLSETVTNTGGTSVTISNVGISGTGFTFTGIATPVTLTAGQSASFSVSFTPPATGSASGNVSITSNASNPTLTIPLSGTGIAQGALGSNPTSLSFGSVQVGTKQTLSETVTNTGGTSVTISNVGVSGTGFTFSGIATPVTLTAGQSASFSVSFTPPSAGAVSGSVTVTSNASNPTLTIPLSGTGIAQGALGSNPTSLSFGSVQVGTKQTLSETVTNTGGTSVTISNVGISGTGFTFTGIATPLTLTAGQSASFSVSFTPPSAGAVSGSVTVTSNASNPTLTIPLSGTGVAAGALTSNPTSLSFGSVQVGT